MLGSLLGSSLGFNSWFIAMWLFVIKYPVVCVFHILRAIERQYLYSEDNHPLALPSTTHNFHPNLLHKMIQSFILRAHKCKIDSENHKNEANHNASLLNCLHAAFILSIKPRLLKSVSKLTVILRQQIQQNMIYKHKNSLGSGFVCWQTDVQQNCTAVLFKIIRPCPENI